MKTSERLMCCSIQGDIFDVAVIGGGTTGCAAAIAAARSGAKTILIEKLPFVGGNMTSGLPWLAFHDKASGQAVVEGIPMEMIRRLQAAGAATEFVMDPITGSAVGVNGSMLKLILTDMLVESGVTLRLHSMVVDTDCQGPMVTGVYVQSKGGCELIRTKLIVDCTDNADVCVAAGAQAVLGRASDHKRQIASNVITYGNIRFGEMLEYFERNPGQIRPFPLDADTLRALLKQMHSAPLFVMGAFESIIAGARADGVPYDRKQLVGVAYPKRGMLVLVASRVEDVDPGDSENLTRSEIGGLEQTWGILRLLRDYIPGCGDAEIVCMGTQLGLRETRHVVGDYTLTAADLMKPEIFADSIARGAYHLDIHSPDHAGLETQAPPIYSIPFRSLVVKGFDNLLVAGRGISATHEAMSSTRIAPISAAQGQAAGTAAALCAADGLKVRELPVDRLQSKLQADGALL